VSVCRLGYTAYYAHAPYGHLWPVRLYNILPHYLINGKNFKNVAQHEMCGLILSINLSKKFIILRITERHLTINVYLSSYKVLAIVVRT